MKKRKTAEQRAYERLEKDGDKWALILYSALALTMCRNWNMKKTAVTRLVNTTWDAWKECAQTNEKSMIMMCEEETGIEIRNGDGKGWRDVAYLNGEDLGPMTEAQWLYMRQQQIKWVRPNIMACILIGLHRKYGFGFDRCARVYAQIEEIEQEFKSDPKRIRRAACLSLWDWVIGRPSPSKVLMMVYGDPRWSEYELQELKYRCWKRKLTKKEWRLLKVRIKNNARTDDNI